ncbi:Uncharacterized protein MBO_200458 [Mycobacterium tuberculosis variant caprae]|nr:Uncharacterized protein MBO_200458 [Mycobacterium tuberculosis variant caprae]
MAFDAAMSTHEDLLATIRYVRDRTGDPNAWQTGLTPTEVTAVVTSTTRSEQLDAILRKIRQRHSNLYYPAPPDREQGDAARAIADAEAAAPCRGLGDQRPEALLLHGGFGRWATARPGKPL